MRSVTFEALWGDGPVNAQPAAPREEKSTGMWTSQSYFSSNLPNEKDSEHADACEVAPPTQRAQTLQTSQKCH